ncbi:hypothetical protein HETIRDRAFT_309724 [Heterobasidion irregulare TC 32-1]|uniref:Uncharacterized protein n=1 Tax=Heterobasidion irregulare (strain TC 32-1) TaxID=747525 RepID=W4KJ52_HETIT|nr:uncharacterized protein HETIRDRAFT_309724 [Heterobasidion irregulare TC 32-1]ETW85872.1 hypothetical protein HETIRDRAFT_309724 [Heterobasidion irregulare TC 32-1]
MTRLLSNQADVRNQVFLLEQDITTHSHICMFLPKFHLNWYCEVYKERFDHAKKHVLKCLDNCPVEVIRCFFNRSWHFIDAYCRGFTRKAVEWAIHKQKSHRTVSQSAMMSIEAVLN